MVPSQRTPAQQPASSSSQRDLVGVTPSSVTNMWRCEVWPVEAAPSWPSIPWPQSCLGPGPSPSPQLRGIPAPTNKECCAAPAQLQLPAAVSGVWILTESLVTTWCFMVASLQTVSRWGSSTGDWRLGSSWLLKYLQLNVRVTWPQQLSVQCPLHL